MQVGSKRTGHSALLQIVSYMSHYSPRRAHHQDDYSTLLGRDVRWWGGARARELLLRVPVHSLELGVSAVKSAGVLLRGLELYGPRYLRVVLRRASCEVESGGCRVERVLARLLAHLWGKGLLYTGDLLDTLAVRSDPSLTGPLGLVPEVLCGLDELS